MLCVPVCRPRVGSIELDTQGRQLLGYTRVVDPPAEKRQAHPEIVCAVAESIARIEPGEGTVARYQQRGGLPVRLALQPRVPITAAAFAQRGSRRMLKDDVRNFVDNRVRAARGRMTRVVND